MENLPESGGMKERPDLMYGRTHCLKVGCGKMYVVVNREDDGKGEMFEFFIVLGKSGGCAQAQLGTIGKLLSRSRRYRVPMKALIKDLKGVRCHNPSFVVRTAWRGLLKSNWRWKPKHLRITTMRHGKPRSWMRRKTIMAGQKVEQTEGKIKLTEREKDSMKKYARNVLGANRSFLVGEMPWKKREEPENEQAGHADDGLR
jgi:hypothetical protein